MDQKKAVLAVDQNCDCGSKTFVIKKFRGITDVQRKAIIQLKKNLSEINPEICCYCQQTIYKLFYWEK